MYPIHSISEFRNQNSTSYLRAVLQLVRIPEIAGHSLKLQNGTVLHFDGIYSKLVWDIQDAFKDLNLEIYFEEDLHMSIQHLFNEEADIVAYPIAQDLDWTGLGTSFVFLHGIISEFKGLFFRQPLYKNYPNILLRPFHYNLWISILFFLIISSALYTSLYNHSLRIPFRLRKLTNSDIATAAVTLILGKIWPSLSHEGAHQISVAYVIPSLYFSALLFIAYSAQVTSNLTNDDGRLVKTREDLITYGYTFCAFGSALVESGIFRLFPNAFHAQLATQPFIPITLKNYAEIVTKVISPKEEGNYVMFNLENEFYMERFNPQIGLRKEFCEIASFPSPIKYPRSMIIKKDSPFRGRLNIILLQLNERGIKFRYHFEYQKRIQNKCAMIESNFVGISSGHVSLAFGLLMAGAITAVLIEGILKLEIFQIKKNEIVNK